MKKTLIITGILAIALIVAMTGTATAAEKIGFVNMRTVIQESVPGQKGFAEIKAMFEKKKAEISKKEDELKKIKDELDKQKSVLTPDAYQEKETNFQVKVRDYQRFAKDAQDELAAKEQNVTAKLIPEILQVVEGVGKKDGYTAIIDLNNPVIVYHDKQDELTKKIIDEYNKSAGKPAPAAKGKK
ncbi:MAG TPA: OmpH family outer membrane protein [Syntrophales bacterium]|nr:OmpH family outer membrane protein [Syntrophales bacterium]